MSILTLFVVLGALPPFAEATSEIQAILKSKELQEYIPYGDAFEKIERIEGGYKIVTNYREVLVTVCKKPSDRLGLKQFDLEFELLR